MSSIFIGKRFLSVQLGEHAQRELAELQSPAFLLL